MAVKKSELYSSLWASCDALRGGMDASQYKDYILTLLFVKYVSDKFTGEDYADIEIPEGGSFDDMVKLIGKKNIGEGINKMHQNAKADERFLTVDQLTGWCFGDPYTRTGLSLKEHEFLTFCYITALGGNWPQVKAHVGGNLNMGTTRGELIDAVTVMMPIIGFPKSLNALGLINEAAPAQE